MNKMTVALLVLGVVAAPGWAQSKLEKAIEKAYEKLEDGKPEDAVKELTKATKDGGAPAWVALGELEEVLGHLEEAEAAYTQARQVASPTPMPASFVE